MTIKLADDTNRQGLREALQILDSRVKHELRGSGDFHGDITVKVSIKNGKIIAVEESVRKSNLVLN